MKYFREEENPTARLPENFVQGFLEVNNEPPHEAQLTVLCRAEIDHAGICFSQNFTL